MFADSCARNSAATSATAAVATGQIDPGAGARVPLRSNFKHALLGKLHGVVDTIVAEMLDLGGHADALRSSDPGQAAATTDVLRAEYVWLEDLYTIVRSKAKLIEADIHDASYS